MKKAAGVVILCAHTLLNKRGPLGENNCLHQTVPGITDVKINPETNTLIREGISSIINPFDMYAIEEGLRIRKNSGAKLPLFHWARRKQLMRSRKPSAWGRMRLSNFPTRLFAGSDSWATAYTLALAIKKIGNFNIILCGKQAIDGDTGQVGPALPASSASLSSLMFLRLSSWKPESSTITVERLAGRRPGDRGSQLPALLTVVKDINQPRATTLFHIRRASSLPFPLGLSSITRSGPLQIRPEGQSDTGDKDFSPPNAREFWT